MYKTLFISALLIGALSPSISHAEDASSTPGDPTPPAPPAPIVIHTTVNVRYEGSLVWTGSVALTQASTASLIDDTGATRTLPSDSALEALAAADAASPDFNISDLAYYADFGSFYVKCINVAAVSKNACDDWQYVVNSAYPPVGSDHYTVSEGDMLYFYFGNPRRVTLESSTAEASTSISVSTESYDYTNNTWTPLAGAQVGATQPNPADQYSPLVPFTAVSGQDGIAHLFITTPGVYGIGLAQDYYSATEPLTITPAQAKAAAATVQSRSQSSWSWSAGGNVATFQTSPVTAASSATTTASTTVATPTTDQAASVAIAADKVLITFDVSLEDFLRRYLEALISLRR